MTAWAEFTDNAVAAAKGIYFLSQELADRVEASSEIGFYIYTKESAYKKNLYKCGLTKAGCVSRIRQQKTAAEVENLYVVDWIPSDLPLQDSKIDEKIHKELDRQGLSEWSGYDADASGVREWSAFPNHNPSELWWDYLNGEQKRIDLTLTIWQQEALERIVKSLGEDKKVIMAELAARFGKTTTYLALLDIIQTKVLVVGSYVLTVASSFKKESQIFSQFENMEYLELSSPTFAEDFNRLLATDKQIVVFASLCGSSTVEDNLGILSQFDDKVVVIDEADYGAHTESKAPVVKEMTGNSPLILTTGTNSERARGEHAVDDMFSVTYFDMLMMRQR